MAEEKQCASASSCSKESCEGCASAKGGNKGFEIENNPNSNIGRVIGVVSGKGGVGKTFVSGSIASILAKEGYKVGVLDADITGPSIPKIYGLSGSLYGDENGAFPMEAEDGTKVMSINFCLDNENDAVAWRGPVIAGAVKQFWTDVQWGDIDYMIVDMPPGTGDVPLTVYQSLPIDGIVIVTSPQDLVSMIVKKSYNLASMMGVPVLGIVENYSYVQCPNCDEKIKIFGDSHIEDLAKELGIPVLGQLPMNADFAAAADAGKIYSLDFDYLEAAKAVILDL